MSHSTRGVLAALLTSAVMTVPAAPAVAAKKPPPAKTLKTNLKNGGVTVTAQTVKAAWDPALEAGKSWKDAQPVSAGPRWEYRETLGCGSTADPDAARDLSTCSLAIARCGPVNGQAVNQLYVWRRIVGTSQWFFVRTTCGTANLPNTVAAPPPTPTLGQIRQAFLELPFGKPSVNIQPEGDVTLVNLPTYFEAQWPDGQLGPSSVSKPVQLLSWSVEFRINPASYNFAFGDGSESGWTDDPGGPYPEGLVRHTYEDPHPGAPVKVDAALTGAYRVNGGSWVDLDGVADLEDEPVTTLRVREAKARLR